MYISLEQVRAAVALQEPSAAGLRACSVVLRAAEQCRAAFPQADSPAAFPSPQDRLWSLSPHPTLLPSAPAGKPPLMLSHSSHLHHPQG